MNLASPISSVIPSSHGVVLEVLARSAVPLSGRSIARLAGDRVSQSMTNRVLKDLTEAGIVARDPAPPAFLYTLNHDHMAAEAVVLLASTRRRLILRIRDEVASWVIGPAAVTLFGSFARGDGDETSDIDILVLRPDDVADEDSVWVEQLNRLGERVTAWSGNDCSLIEYTESEYSRLADEGERLPDEVDRDGIPIWGTGVRGATHTR